MRFLVVAVCTVCAVVGGYLGYFLAYCTTALVRRRRRPATKRTKELEKITARVKKIPTADLGGYLEMATTANFDAVRSWTRASNPLQRAAHHAEALTAARTQAAILEEQQERGLV